MVNFEGHIKVTYYKKVSRAPQKFIIAILRTENRTPKYSAFLTKTVFHPDVTGIFLVGVKCISIAFCHH
jgi:hypothetical protein